MNNGGDTLIDKQQFDVLRAIQNAGAQHPSQRHLAELTGMSLGKVNGLLAELREAGLTDDKSMITPAGLQALEPYRVKNAVIMAAGMSSRFAPLSYEKPKALLKVKGELLIEREIRQLQEAGIRDITLVVGYMKEKMFYLADKFGVKIVVNDDYYRYNNTSTLMLVLNELDNTYICSSDNYFVVNPFEPYVYRAYYSAVYTPDKTDEYCITYNRKGRITGVVPGGQASWYMLGHVYFDRSFSRKFSRILKESYDQQVTREHLWEDLYIRYIGELEMYIRKYDADVIKEFDSLDELRDFDEHYIGNSDSAIFRNICSVLKCSEEDIHEIKPLKAGLTNLSFVFTCKGQRYVYRHPGVGTSAYINRKSEAESMRVACELGLDDTFIYMDDDKGWKISRFVEDAKLLDYHDREQVDAAMDMLRRLHQSGKKTPYFFDIWEGIAHFEETLRETKRDDFEDMAAMREELMRLRGYLDADQVAPCLCHRDSYSPNFLLDRDGKMYLIDWEYSGMTDPGADVGVFIACSDYTQEEAVEVIRMYCGKEPEPEVLRHFIGYTAVTSFYWFLWALYQDSIGKNVGSFLYKWYRYTKSYGAYALSLYENVREMT